MSGDFLDSNVLVYLVDSTQERKHSIARNLVERALAQRTSVISHQVVHETLNAITRRIAAPVTPEDAGRFMHRVLVPLWRLMPSSALFDRALDLQARYGYSFYDSLIIAAAIEGGCDRLLTEDLQHGQRIEGVTIENPFVA